MKVNIINIFTVLSLWSIKLQEQQFRWILSLDVQAGSDFDQIFKTGPDFSYLVGSGSELISKPGPYSKHPDLDLQPCKRDSIRQPEHAESSLKTTYVI